MDALIKNIYRDLRDRHLLLPVLALVVALIVAPKLLGSDPETSPPPAAPAASNSAKSDQLTPAVLADDEVSVRDYRKRLKQLKKKNPFKQQLRGSSGGGQSGGDGAGTGAGAGTSASSGGAADSTVEIPLPGLGSSDSGTGSLPSGPSQKSSPGPSGDDGGSPADTGTGGDAGQQGDGSKGSGGGHGGKANDPEKTDIKVVNHLFTRRIDVRIGQQGETKPKKNVMPMTTLPNDKNPVAAYLGTDEKGKRAAFVVSRDVAEIGGDGACVPSPENCLFITLEKGETAKLTFADDEQGAGQTYKLRLVAIRKHEVPSG